MKKKYLIIGSLAFFQFIARAQQPKDTSAVHKVPKTAIELVYNQYNQDGENAAVTGGVGTEKLQVYGPSLTVIRSWKNKAVSVNAGVDIISSASTDNIDFVLSSASAIDARSYANIGYEQDFDEQGLTVYGGVGFSIESDYFSVTSKLGVAKQNKTKSRKYTAQFQMFNDDLRWGRLDGNEQGPAFLIYPSELRSREWHDTYRRNTFALKLGMMQVVNKRNTIGIYPEVVYQKGLLSTPFHRVYFNDGSLRVEDLPDERLKFGVAAKWNSFVGGNVILKNTINGYTDDFGILAFAIENETVIKVKPFLTVLPTVRFYAQQGSTYFQPFGGHRLDARYYTSDFDLSTLETYSAGLGVKYSPSNYKAKRLTYNTIVLRYNYIQRSTDLSAHMFSITLGVEVKDK